MSRLNWRWGGLQYIENSLIPLSWLFGKRKGIPKTRVFLCTNLQNPWKTNEKRPRSWQVLLRGPSGEGYFSIFSGLFEPLKVISEK